jgi:hypothetical protein
MEFKKDINMPINSVTQDMVKMTLVVVACVGSVAGYIEYRATDHCDSAKIEIEQRLLALRNEVNADLRSKYDAQAGIKIEQILENQKELLKVALENQKEIQETTREVLKISQRLELEVDKLKSK